MQESEFNISSKDILFLNKWVDDPENKIPENIKVIIKNLLNLPSHLANSTGNKESLLRLLKTLMKFIPSSEKGNLDLKM